MTAPTRQEQTWFGYTPAPSAPEGLAASDNIAAAVKAAQDAEVQSIAATEVLHRRSDSLRPKGQAGEFASQRGVPVMQSLSARRAALLQEGEADQVAVKAAGQKMLAPLNKQLTGDQKEMVSLFREMAPQQRNEYLNAAVGGRKPELLEALALADTMMSRLSEEQRDALRHQIATAATTEQDQSFMRTMRTRAEQRGVALKYVDAVIREHKKASDRAVLEQAGVVGPRIQDLTGPEKSALIGQIGIQEFERRLLDG